MAAPAVDVCQAVLAGDAAGALAGPPPSASPEPALSELPLPSQPLRPAQTINADLLVSASDKCSLARGTLCHTHLALKLQDGANTILEC